jgi:hypothetical protein
MAIQCTNGHQRSTHEDNWGLQVPCPEWGIPVTVPRAMPNPPCYGTDRLEVYARSYARLAEALFQLTGRLCPRNAKRADGRYSVTASSSQERAAKIMICQREFGQERGQGFPQLHEGVYVMIRANDASAGGIWTKEMTQQYCPVYFAMMSPTQTLGVAPPCAERFAYFRLVVNEPLERLEEIARADQETLEGALATGAVTGVRRFVEVAALLEACSRV